MACMFCTRCGKCGLVKPIADSNTCAMCGAEIEKDATVCLKCGAPKIILPNQNNQSTFALTKAASFPASP